MTMRLCAFQGLADWKTSNVAIKRLQLFAAHHSPAVWERSDHTRVCPRRRALIMEIAEVLIVATKPCAVTRQPNFQRLSTRQWERKNCCLL